MRLLLYDWRETRRDKRRARRAFRDYARNGWESPWLRLNSPWRAMKR